MEKHCRTSYGQRKLSELPVERFRDTTMVNALLDAQQSTNATVQDNATTLLERLLECLFEEHIAPIDAVDTLDIRHVLFNPKVNLLDYYTKL
ncbi:hypothetical protein PsorP6_015813 [Peronosclerospora sorghi]|uniref:Uncharacterized protein n=1 Tax=Peronosclerospora sorghi TaxID=230839 RepID=A0ACC0WP74_9STRA|nr:hypothetical protein PsorP6_015813 [Peronosclerospora sorghi]